LFQCCERIAQHGGQTEFSRRLIESPECLHVVCIEFKQLPDQMLGYFGWGQIHPVQRTKQRQQVQPCSFQSRAKVRRDCDGRMARHNLRMPQYLRMVNGAVCRKQSG
jgi:hypothetical protein